MTSSTRFKNSDAIDELPVDSPTSLRFLPLSNARRSSAQHGRVFKTTPAYGILS